MDTWDKKSEKLWLFKDFKWNGNNDYNKKTSYKCPNVDQRKNRPLPSALIFTMKRWFAKEIHRLKWFILILLSVYA